MTRRPVVRPGPRRPNKQKPLNKPIKPAHPDDKLPHDIEDEDWVTDGDEKHEVNDTTRQGLKGNRQGLIRGYKVDLKNFNKAKAQEQLTDEQRKVLPTDVELDLEVGKCVEAKEDNPIWLQGSGLVTGIKPKGLSTVIGQPDIQKPSYLVIDLRSGDDFANPEDRRQIQDAKHLPLLMRGAPPNKLSWTDLSCDNKSYLQRDSSFDRMIRNWDAIAMHPLLPVAEAQDKQYVFFHCQLSNERTPRVAIGFKMWSVYRGHNMTVGMLEGGWADWKESGGPTEECEALEAVKMEDLQRYLENDEN